MKKYILTLATPLVLSGCIGSNAVTEKVMTFNLKAVDNRYARGGLNMLLAPVYGVAVAADYIVFNSIEFWSGKNIINGKPHIFDSKMDTYIEVNDQIHDSLKTAPIDPLTNQRMIEKGEMQKIDDNTIQMNITYNNGEKATLIGVRNDNDVSYYLDGELVTQTSIEELEAYLQTNA
ncbi:hypothetical protein CCZ37_12195 [Vibrio qinghaiensis]|uniref:DUF3332 domain-containing protein n=1 Tax=Vibrio qinghaiensis TaxID=2025808 RepID=A0A223N0C9_9VIBR|nr:DUF3332 domain-containing protein [Vibrio qinghaiensis]ASU23302.1 hypothetical protein CCZ37_12195 [Vibrio qinghaiensis]